MPVRRIVKAPRPGSIRMPASGTPHSALRAPHSPRLVAIANRHPRLRFKRAEVVRAIRILDAGHSALRIPRSALPSGELSLVFLTDPALAKIHADFMDDPSPTDAITFEGDPAAGAAGEICVSVDTAARVVGLPLAGRPRPSARRQAPALQNLFTAELTLYLVHGWLHLAGHDDLVPAKKRRMRAAERRALALLRKHAAIPGFRLD